MLMKAVIVGTGDMAHGLANMYHCFGNKEDYQLVVTEPLPNIKHGEFFHDTKVRVVGNLEEAILDADLVVLAIPGQFIKSFVKSHEHLLCDGSKILVDPSNYKAAIVMGHDTQIVVVHYYYRVDRISLSVCFYLLHDDGNQEVFFSQR